MLARAFSSNVELTMSLPPCRIVIYNIILNLSILQTISRFVKINISSTLYKLTVAIIINNLETEAKIK